MTEKIIGNYRFRDEEDSVIGKGAFGCVFKGVNVSNEDFLAIKRLPKAAVKEAELDLIKSLRSDYIVKVFELVHDSDYYYVVMELCDCTLELHIEQRVNANQPALRLDNVNKITETLAQGCHELHKLGIIHRDIKPSNILIQYQSEVPPEAKGTRRSSFSSSGNEKLIGHAKISDFGSSRLASSAVELDTLAGTPLYMAPEIGANVLDRSNYGSPVDMWSVGVVLYQCLVGTVPFDEAALCRLFLTAASHDSRGYRGPALPPNTTPFYARIIPRLLELDYRKRITPEEFHAFVTSGVEAPVVENGCREKGRRERLQWRQAAAKVLQCAAICIATHFSTISLNGYPSLSSPLPISKRRPRMRRC